MIFCQFTEGSHPEKDSSSFFYSINQVKINISISFIISLVYILFDFSMTFESKLNKHVGSEKGECELLEL